MSRHMFLFVVVLLSVICAACDGSDCTNCVSSPTGQQLVNVDGQYVQPTPKPSYVQQSVKNTKLSLDSKTDKIGLGNTVAKINAFTESCMASNGTTRQIDAVTIVCEH